MNKRSVLQTGLAVVALTASAWSIAAAPAPTLLKFQSEGRCEGPAAFFVHPGTGPAADGRPGRQGPGHEQADAPVGTGWNGSFLRAAPALAILAKK